jgi:hypothetical protein
MAEALVYGGVYKPLAGKLTANAGVVATAQAAERN